MNPSVRYLYFSIVEVSEYFFLSYALVQYFKYIFLVKVELDYISLILALFILSAGACACANVRACANNERNSLKIAF